MDPLANSKMRLFQTVSVFMWVLCLVAVATFFFIINANKAIDTSSPQTISVDGKAERYVAPDIARINFTESQRAKTAAAAQEVASKKINDVIAFLKESGIEEKDIKTTGYQIYPVHEYYYWNENTGIRCSASYCPPPYYQKEEIVAYRVEQSVEVKVRKVEDAGKIIAGIGAKGIQNIGGLSLEVENYEKIAEEVKNEAIKDARAKAKERAKSLGVSLGDIVGVSDGYNPYYYARGGAETSKVMALNAMDQAAPSVAPTISTGENKIEASVNVTYEID
jgi:uncharacterized protein